ncbi:hypothetical protein DOTSEDRAFT_68466 [Dothistroma septosporum NZE10]|uniref:Uncharacterized protein n=1 Tax=Dothistroma septosporum (strain NZE10 / CBS 128990) TaxID=675120 RepID=N1Q4T4_DOTSN|nr:hypothetical protein DOTSEDRAFT_68466 [Dothistroma septosporum NZE10]
MAFLRPISRVTTRRPVHLTRFQAPARTLTYTPCMRLKEDKIQTPEEIESAKQEQLKTGKRREELESASESVVGADREEVSNHDNHIKELQQEGAKEKQKEHPEGKS